MPVHETNDAQLPNFICKHAQVIVKFTAEDCPVCKELAPAYQELSEQERYRDIIFLKLDAEENPVTSKEVKQNGTPFIATYRNGVLKNYKLVSGENDIVIMLDELVNWNISVTYF